MPRSIRFFVPSIFVLLVAAVPAQADDWPGWRGPQRDGKSGSAGLLSSWPDGGPPLAWRATGLGSGYSSVSVAAERIFTMGDLEDGQYALALSASDGSMLWKRKIGPTWDDNFLGPRSTPTADGDHVYVLSTEGDLYCLATASGEVTWQRSLPNDFGAAMMQAMGTTDWRFSESPLVDGDRVLVTPGVAAAAMVALDKSTGEELWRAAIPKNLGDQGTDGAAYSSVVVSNAGGVKQYVQFIGRGLIGVEAESGRLLWSYNPIANDIANIATPIIDGDYVFASSGYGTGSALVKLSKSDAGIQAEEIYFLEADTMQNHHGGLILHDGYVYTGTGHNKGFPIAVELDSGKVAWGPVRNQGKSSAALSYADGHLYFRYQDGLMVLVEATPEAYREKGSFRIPEVKRESWPHPVIANGLLYLREQDNLFVYDLRAEKGATMGGAP